MNSKFSLHTCLLLLQYHGGTNFGRTGAAYMITSYYDQAPLDEYGTLFKDLNSITVVYLEKKD